jgi:D-galactarolactone cycloisomerase
MTGLSQSTRVQIERIEAKVVRTPIEVPIRTSFGVMRDRPALFLKVTDRDGTEGFGEVWCNFPSVGAEHRARLAQEVIGPLLIASGELEVSGIFAHLMQRLHILAVQSGEWGPFWQVAAGLDAASHDLAARKARLPLWRFLDASKSGRIRAYASGIGPETPAEMAAAAAGRGHTTFKLKVGFGTETDLKSLTAIRSVLSDGHTLLTDANQGSGFDDARIGVRMCADHGAMWIEEPMAADRPLTEWTALAHESAIALAGGENITRLSDFEAALAAKIFGYLQPDAAKWGGVSGCLAVARLALGAGVAYCPHFLGSGIGLMTSAHLLAAAGGDGWLEMDVNPNPLRDALVGGALPLLAGSIQLSEAVGIGIEPDWRAL